jgi:carbonic anhydrase
MKLFAFMLCAGLSGYAGIGFAQEHNLSANPQEQLYTTPEADHGSRQSPVNIISSDSRHAAIHKVTFNYHPSTKTVLNLGHAIQVKYDEGNTLGYEGRLYDLKQFHFHTPSEHLIDGVTYPMELHIVHTLKQEGSQTPVYLVIGLLFKEGKTNPFLDKFLSAIPDSTGATNHLANEYLDINELLAQSGHLHYYHYDGSLTTPPYTETVTWLLVKHIFEASPEQIEKLNRVEGNNARHFQQLNNRKVDDN